MTTSERPTSDATCPVLSEELVELAWSDLLNRDDRTSPEEYPDMALIKFDELREIIASFVTASRASAPASPAIGIQAVTDAMVERALDAAEYIPNTDNRKWMRAALEASCLTTAAPLQADALHPAPECEGADDPEERCPRHPSDCTCWQVDLDHSSVRPEAASAGAAGETMGETISAYEFMAQEFDRLAILRKMWSANEVAATIRKMAIPSQSEDRPPAAPSDTAPSPKGVSDGVRDVLDERRRQIEAEGWTPEHDDQHAGGEIAAAAAAYAFSAFNGAGWRAFAADAVGFWPWNVSWWKPTTPRRDLVKAGALILAEIERLDRAALSQEHAPGRKESQ